MVGHICLSMRQHLQQMEEKYLKKYSVQYFLAMIFVPEGTKNCTSEPLNVMGVVRRTNGERLYWLSHVVRVKEDVAANQVFNGGYR